MEHRMSMRNVAFVVIAVTAALYFWSLGSYALIEPDEGRYAEIPREMNESGDWASLRLHGVRYFEKPPLYYWMTAYSQKIFGGNELAVRVPGALCAIFGACAAGMLARRMFGAVSGVVTIAVLATSILYYAVGRLALTDMPLTFFFTVSMMAFWYADTACDRTAFRLWSVIFWASMGAGVLTKGLIAVVLPCGIVFWYSVLMRDMKPLRPLFSMAGILSFIFVTVPAFYFVIQKDPDFFDFFFIREHFLRYTTRIHGRYEPFWFFLPIVPAGLLPWIGLLPPLLAQDSAARVPGDRDKTVFLLVWLAVVLIFFSLSSSKLIPYVVPCLPPLAILISANAAKMIKTGAWSGRGLVWTAGVNIVFAVALVVYPHLQNRFPVEQLLPMALGAAASLILGPVAAYRLTRRARGDASSSMAAAYAALFCAAVLFYASLSGLWVILGETRGMREVSEVLSSEASDSEIAVYNEILHGITWYTGRRAIQVGDVGELSYGYEREEADAGGPVHYHMTEDVFRSVWASGERMALVIKQSLVESAGIEISRRIDVGNYAILFR